MKLTPVLRRWGPVCFLLASLAAPLAGQHTLFAERDGKFFVVRRVHGNTAIVEVSGKQVVADEGQYNLEPSDDYLPVFVAVRDVEVKIRHLNMGGATMSREWMFQATCETPYALDDVYVVLVMTSATKEKTIFVQEVGALEPHQSKLVTAKLRLAFDLGKGKYTLHLFSGGQEVLQSRIPPAEREAALDRMTARRISGVRNAAPQLFTGPSPEYPRELLKEKTKGQAVISLRIGPNGQVYDPAVKHATDPAFGRSALEAVQQWRFLPRVQGGRAVETRVDVPFNFTPPTK